MIDTSADATRLSPWWRHSAILVMIAGFSVLSVVTVLTYTNAPPIPEQVTDGAGTVVFTGADIQMGQEVFGVIESGGDIEAGGVIQEVAQDVLMGLLGEPMVRGSIVLPQGPGTRARQPRLAQHLAHRLLRGLLRRTVDGLPAPARAQ